MSTVYRQWITSEPSVMFGKPVVVGTRVTVELILERMAAGEAIDQILEAFPNISRDAVLAALAFAADSMKSEVVHAHAAEK